MIKAGTKDGLKVGDILIVYRPKTVTAGEEVLTIGVSAASAEVLEGKGFKTGDIVKSGGDY